MERYRVRREGGVPRLEVPCRGARLLQHPTFNKGTGFTREERAALGLEGLLPDAQCSLEQQSQRVFAGIVRQADPLERYVGLLALQDRNETLFHRVLVDHLEELLPVVHGPTVAEACRRFSHIFRRGRGLWISPRHRGRIEEVLGNAPFEDPRLLVVTDNERVMGLGDMGAGGMAVPVGKLAVYGTAAGIHPTQMLAVSLDVGTDNPELLEDELYLGWRRPRLRGDEYEALVEEFVAAVKRRFPNAILQWEETNRANAFRLLERYRRLLPTFNDDVQGTAALALAALLAAGRATGTPLARQRVVIAGAGPAGIGIARLVRDSLRRAGVSGEDLVSRVAVLDSHGLLVNDVAIAESCKRELAWPTALALKWGLRAWGARDLGAVVRALAPTALVGVSGQAGLFDADVVRTLASRVTRPLVLPLSSPEPEARPGDVLAWTEGRALVAVGRFAETVEGSRPAPVAQATNALVTPGLALGALVSRAYEITDGMFRAAAERLAHEVPDEELAAGRLFPRLREVRRVAARVAEAVVREAGNSGVGLPLEDEAVPQAVAGAMWDPAYLPEESLGG